MATVVKHDRPRTCVFDVLGPSLAPQRRITLRRFLVVDPTSLASTSKNASRTRPRVWRPTLAAISDRGRVDHAASRQSPPQPAARLAIR